MIFSSKYLLSFLVVFSALVGLQLNAQDPEIKASAPSVVSLGQSFNYSVAGNFDGKVTLPEMPGIRVIGGPSTFISQQSSNVNGRLQTTRQVTYSYTFQAEQEGDLVIPPAKVTAGRKEYLTNEIIIKVIRGSQQAKASTDEMEAGTEEDIEETKFVRITPSRKSIYTGEQILLNSKIFTQEQLQIADIKVPALEGFWKEELKGDESSRRETLKGQSYLTLVFNRYLLTAQKPGEIRINPVEVSCLVQKRVKSRTNTNPFNDPFFNDPFFNDAFFDRIQTVKESIFSNPLTITVKPLPSNQPAGFNGAVGNFTIRARMDKNQVMVNDALTLNLTVTGQGNLMLLKPLKVDFPPDLEIFEPKFNPSIKHTEQGTSGSVTFEYLIIPRHAGKFRIPPIIFSYFDPSTEKYRSLQTEEFNFSVEKSGVQDESFIASPGGNIRQGRMDAAQGKTVVNLADDILHIKLNPPGLGKTGSTLFGSRPFILTYIIVLVLFTGIIIFKRERIRRNADINAVRNRKARRVAQKRLKVAYRLLREENEDFYEEILKALWGFVSDKLGINISELSRELISLKLQSLSVPDELYNKLWNVIDVCELARYGSGYKGDKQVLYNQVIQLISDLQENIK